MNVTNLEMAQASVEFFGFCLCLILSIIIKMSKPQRKSWNMFVDLFLTIAFMFLGEAAVYLFRGNTNTLSLVINRVANFLVFILGAILANQYVRYACYLTEDANNDNNDNVMIFRVNNIVTGIAIAIVVSNVFTKWMYFFDASNYYHRNTMWYSYIVILLLSLVLGIYIAVTRRRSLSSIRMASLVIFALIPVLASIIQSYYYGFSFVLIGVGAGIVVMLLTYLSEWVKSDGIDINLLTKRNKWFEEIVLFIIMVICMSASIVSCIISIGRISKDTARRDSQIVAHMVAENIEKEFIRPITVSETMCKDYNLQSLITEGDMAPEEIEEDMTIYLKAICEGMGYEKAFVVVDSSKAYYSNNGIERIVDVENNSYDIWYKDFVNSQKTYLMNVDTVFENNQSLAVFVNAGIKDDNGKLIGACGVAMDMTKLQEIIRDYQREYNVDIKLVNKNGLVQVASDYKDIENLALDTTYFSIAGDEEFIYQTHEFSSTLTKYIPELDWYIVIEDYQPHTIETKRITSPSIIIFVVGILAMGLAFWAISIREQKASRALIAKHKISLTDELTGVSNRRAFDDYSAQILEEKSLGEHAIVMMDINGLKSVNDTRGHIAGDELIIGASQCMNQAFSEIGQIFRTGGDEFVALLKCDKAEALKAIKVLDELIEGWHGELVDELTVSKGVVICSEHAEKSFVEMTQLADRYMYDDKREYYIRTGKDRRRV